MPDSTQKIHTQAKAAKSAVQDKPLAGHPLNSGFSATPVTAFKTLTIAPYIAASLALIWWVAAGVFLFDWLNTPSIANLAMELKIAAIIAAIMPGLVLIIASYMVLEVRRSQALSQDIAQAIRHLLAPVESKGAEFDVIANAVSAHTHRLGTDIDQAGKRTEQIISGISQSLESLTKTTKQMKIDGLTVIEGLRDESQRLDQANTNTHAHIDNLTQAFPAQAKMLGEMIQTAEQEMGKAEQLLAKRTESVSQSSDEITKKLLAMEQDAMQSEQRAAAMNELVSGIHTRIGEMVGRVENVLNMAEQAREASRIIACEITQNLQNSVSESAGVLEKLERANAEIGQRADGVVSLVEKQTEQAEEKITNLGNSLYNTAAEATRIAETGLNNARYRIEKATRLLSQSDLLKEGEAEGKSDESGTPEAVLAEINKPGLQPALKPWSAPDSQKQGDSKNAGGAAEASSDQAAESATGPKFAFWGNFLSDIDDSPPLPKNPDELIQYLLDSGVLLRQAITVPDLRRIAVANHEGVAQRRAATRKVAPGYLRDIEEMLERSPELRELSKQFVTEENSTVSGALTQAEKGKANADPRLCAYLLIDAALGHQS